MTQTINKSEMERRKEEAIVKMNLKFLKYSDVVAMYLSNKEEGRI